MAFYGRSDAGIVAAAADAIAAIRAFESITFTKPFDIYIHTNAPFQMLDTN